MQRRNKCGKKCILYIIDEKKMYFWFGMQIYLQIRINQMYHKFKIDNLL